MLRTLAVVVAGLTILAGTAVAGIPDPDYSTVTLGPDQNMVSCPGGEGPTYEFVTVNARRADNTPIAEIPSTSFFFTITGGNVTMTCTSVPPETDVNGDIQFNMVADETIELLSPSELGVECMIYTIVLNDYDGLQVNTFDLNGNGCVDLADFSMFSSIYLTNNPRGDYNWSGQVDLPDFGMFSAHYLHGNCP
jgi:hypothetical protein